MPSKPASRRGTSSLVGILRALSHESRIRILFLLGRDGAMDVTTIARSAEMPADDARHQLARLYELGPVDVEPRGKRRLYRVTNSVRVGRAGDSKTLTFRAPDGGMVRLRREEGSQG